MTAGDGRPLPGQPAVPGNDWPSLLPPALGGWTPTRTVSVVVPAHDASRTLPYALAALAQQTYPAELTEVVVVDDGSDPPLTLPAERPEHTRMVTTSASWGRAHACHVGACAAQGEVLHWLDADLLAHPDELEAQMRWHHLVDYAVVLGTKTFVDVADGLPDLEELARMLREGRATDLFPGRWTSPHTWVEEQIEHSQGLTANPTMSYLVHVGASASVGRDLYLDTGGMDPELKLGEDVELGYRLGQQGALFVPDREALSWHLGRSTLMADQDRVNAYNRPFVTDRVPDLRHWRTKGRSYTVPWVEVVVDATEQTYTDVRHSVIAVLTGAVTDVRVVVLGPWLRLTDGRRSPLADPDRDLRMVRAELEGDPRVRFVEELPRTAFPATFRLLLPTGWAPGPDTVRRLAREMTRRDRGLVSMVLPDGRTARLERTSAFNRAARVAAARPDRDMEAGLDDLVDQVSRTWWFDGPEEGFTHVCAVPATEPGTRAAGGGRPGRTQTGSARRDDLAGDGTQHHLPSARDLLSRAIRRRR